MFPKTMGNKDFLKKSCLFLAITVAHCTQKFD